MGANNGGCDTVRLCQYRGTFVAQNMFWRVSQLLSTRVRGGANFVRFTVVLLTNRILLGIFINY